MPWYRLHGMTVHMRGSRLPVPCGAASVIDGKNVLCLAPSGFLCDGPASDGRARDYQGYGTCSTHLCEAHAHQVGPDRHYCPTHHREHEVSLAQPGLFTELVK